MIKLLIIADDFTGALDTGVQFAMEGINTKILNDINYDFNKIEDNVEILTINSETRHIPYKDAYKIIYDLVKRALKFGIKNIYKKTDSALRGNIGAELEAVINASNEKSIVFIPALPKMNRCTENGIQYINNIPVALSVFGKDPFEPVKYSYIPDIIKEQSNIKTNIINIKNDYNNEYKDGVCIFDAKEYCQIEKIVNHLKQENKLNLMAGCAGFASVLPKALGITKNKKRTVNEVLDNKFLVVCGSVNLITKKQLDFATLNNFKRINLKPFQILDNNYFKTKDGQVFLDSMIKIINKEKYLIIDSNDLSITETTIQYAKNKNIPLDEIRLRISNVLGYITKVIMLDQNIKTTLFITGGDTLLGFMNEVHCKEIIPICEIEPGIVLSKFYINNKTFKVISKSGGFGDEKLLVNISEKIK